VFNTLNVYKQTLKKHVYNLLEFAVHLTWWHLYFRAGKFLECTT